MPSLYCKICIFDKLRFLIFYYDYFSKRERYINFIRMKLRSYFIIIIILFKFSLCCWYKIFLIFNHICFLLKHAEMGVGGVLFLFFFITFIADLVIIGFEEPFNVVNFVFDFVNLVFDFVNLLAETIDFLDLNENI